VADSLVLARTFELLGGGQPSALPQCAGAYFRLGRGYDFGDPAPVVDLLTTLMGDGSRPIGWRVDNRTVVMPVTIQVPSSGSEAADRLLLSAARELLLEAIAAEEFTLVWGPDGQTGALNLVWDCFRAHAATVTHDVIQNRQLISELVITFDALPFGRSDVLTPVVFDNPLAGQVPAPQPLTVDDYSAVSSSTSPALWTQSPAAALFTNSARWHHDLSDGNTPLNYTRTLPAAVDLTGLGKLTFWLGLGADPGRWRAWKRNTPVNVVVTLTDASARTLSFSTRQAANTSEDQDWPKWNQVSLTIPQGRAFTYSNVTKYQITAWSEVHTHNHTTELDATGYLSGLRGIPAAGPKRPASSRGADYVLYDIIGTAPSPLSVQCQLGVQEQVALTQTIFLPGTPGAASAYTAPPENPNWLATDSAGFEQGTTGSWTGADGAAANATLTASSAQVHAGAFSLRLAATAAATMTAASTTAANVSSQGLPCQPGDRVAVRAWVRAAATARNVTVGAEFFNNASASLGIVALGAVTDSTTAWTQISGRVTAPANAAFARLTVAVASPAAAEQHYVDDAYLAFAVQATVVCRGAGAAGGTVEPSNCAGGGAGSGEIAWETSLDLTPGGTHAYTVGAGGIRNKTAAGRGGDGGDSFFTGTSVTVRAHGGLGGANCIVADFANGAGGTGGTGSTNSHHFNGGSGATGDRVNYRGGGAGGPAGDGGAGAAGGSGQANNPGLGGAAGALGIPGGQGGAGAAGQPVNFGSDGSTGQGDGAGGGGAACQSHERLGANGNNGSIRLIIKTYTNQSQFSALVVHRLSGRSGLLAKPIIEVGASLDPPDGREYTIDQVDGQNAVYRGTYSGVLSAWSWNGTAARQVTITIRQYASGVQVASGTISALVTPAQVQNGLAVLGEITLPLLDIAPDNNDAYFTVAVTSANTADRFLDILLLDTQGSTFLVNVTGGAGFTNYYIDAPDATSDVGRVLGSNAGRSSAVSVLGQTFASGGPLRLEPGDNILTVYSPSGQPALYGEYEAHWWHERLA
jgi:hypothetical protein